MFNILNIYLNKLKAIANDSLLFCSLVKKANMVMDRKGRPFESQICRFCEGKQRGFRLKTKKRDPQF